MSAAQHYNPGPHACPSTDMLVPPMQSKACDHWRLALQGHLDADAVEAPTARFAAGPPRALARRARAASTAADTLRQGCCRLVPAGRTPAGRLGRSTAARAYPAAGAAAAAAAGACAVRRLQRAGGGLAGRVCRKGVGKCLRSTRRRGAASLWRAARRIGAAAAAAVRARVQRPSRIRFQGRDGACEGAERARHGRARGAAHGAAGPLRAGRVGGLHARRQRLRAQAPHNRRDIHDGRRPRLAARRLGRLAVAAAPAGQVLPAPSPAAHELTLLSSGASLIHVNFTVTNHSAGGVPARASRWPRAPHRYVQDIGHLGSRDQPRTGAGGAWQAAGRAARGCPRAPATASASAHAG